MWSSFRPPAYLHLLYRCLTSTTPLPAPTQTRADLVQIQAAGLNAVRLYHVPPEWFLHEADALGLLVLVDVPWPKHVCFLDSHEAQRQAQ